VESRNTFSEYAIRRRRMLGLPFLETFPFQFGHFFHKALHLLVQRNGLAHALVPGGGDANLAQLAGMALHQVDRLVETRRYEITHVPAPVRNRDRLIGTGEPVLPRYERIAFEKSLIAPQGEPLAAFVCPGHPLLDATLDLTLDRHRDLLRRGTMLIDESDAGTTPRVLFYLEHAVQDASLLKNGDRRTISKQMLYVELDATGNARHLHYAPYLDYRPMRDDEPGVDALLARPESAWITRDLERKALPHAIAEVVPEHLSVGRSGSSLSRTERISRRTGY
jgi:hypothetical protein